MKKIISWGMMLAAAFTLTNCAKEIDVPVQELESVGYPFEIIASTVGTKTVNDGMSTKWAAGDQINVFHALGESENYVDNGAFTVLDVEKGRFTGTLKEQLNVEEEYDWYVLYPYSSYIKTPGAKTDGYTYIGYSSGLNQSGYDSMASLKGSVCPLYGVLKYGGVKPVIEMQHLSSIVAIKVTNDTNQALTINTASFTATEDIVGSYFIDITKTPVEYTAKTAIATATVNVSDGTALAKGESATLYAAIKPFTAAAGQKLTLSVNGYSKEIELSKDVTFTAGKIKALNFKYDYVEEPSQEDETAVTISFANATDRTSWSTAEQVWERDGVIFKNTKTSESSNVVENVNPVRLYKNSIITLSAPSNILKIEFESNSTEYATALKNSINGSTISGTKVSVVLDGTSSAVNYTLSGGQVRLNSLTVTYVGGDYVPPVLESIAVSGDYETEFTQGDEFTFGGTVIATFDNGTSKDVTSSATFSGYNMSEVGTQEVIVTYEGKTATYYITIAEKQQGAKTWTLVTDASTLNAGDQIVIVAKNNNYAMSTTQNSNNRGHAAVTKSGSTISEPSSSVQILTLETGKSDGTFAFNTGSGYLYAASSSKNYLKTEKTLSANSSWKITITSAGVATIKATGSNTRNWIRYNSSNNPPIFSCYSSGQTDVCIYKLQ